MPLYRGVLEPAPALVLAGPTLRSLRSSSGRRRPPTGGLRPATLTPLRSVAPRRRSLDRPLGR